MARLVTTDELMAFLGADDEARPDVERARAAAIEELYRATGTDWEGRAGCETASETVRIMAYLSFYAVRDAAGNTEFLERRRTQLINHLRYAPPEEVPAVGTE